MSMGSMVTRQLIVEIKMDKAHMTDKVAVVDIVKETMEVVEVMVGET